MAVARFSAYLCASNWPQSSIAKPEGIYEPGRSRASNDRGYGGGTGCRRAETERDAAQARDPAISCRSTPRARPAGFFPRLFRGVSHGETILESLSPG